MSTTEDARKAASELAEAIRQGNEAAIVYWQVRLAAIERGHRRGHMRGYQVLTPASVALDDQERSARSVVAR